MIKVFQKQEFFLYNISFGEVEINGIDCLSKMRQVTGNDDEFLSKIC